jgi:HK97 gp10 family phage protein
MIKLSIPPAEMKKVTEEIRKRKSVYEQNVAKELFKGALDIESGAKQRAPVDTGRLRSSIQSKIDKEDVSAEVTVNVDYAPYVEFGTGQYAKAYLAGKPREMVDHAREFYKTGNGYRPARPYLFPTYYEQRPKIIARVKKAKI